MVEYVEVVFEVGFCCFDELGGVLECYRLCYDEVVVYVKCWWFWIV